MELDSMVSLDQQWRGMLKDVRNGKNDSITEEEIWLTIKEIDQGNYYEIMMMYFEHGFLGYNKVGEKSSHQFWLLVQHMDAHPEFQKQVLEAMKKEVDIGNASPSDYAYLYDRVELSEDRPQKYGSQLVLDAKTQLYKARPLVDSSNVDRYRNEMGLSDLQTYLDQTNKYLLGK